MHPSEINDVLKTMTCIIDTKEQNTPKLRRRMRDIKLPIVRESLNVGDYSGRLYLPDGKQLDIPVSIERKMNLTELCGCFCGQHDANTGKNRFDREFDRAKQAGIRVWLLVESSVDDRNKRYSERATWEDIYAGKYLSKMHPHSFVAKILTFQARYDCRIIFCDYKTSGQLIHDILYYEARELLERMADE